MSPLPPAILRALLSFNFRMGQMKRMKQMINTNKTPQYSSSFFGGIALLLLCALGAAGCDNAPSTKPYKFDMTRINQDGSVNDGKNYASQPWACVHDNKTNLMWEVKKTESGLQSATNTYSWYDEDKDSNGGWAGKANAGVCAGSNCDTQSYVKAINEKKLCGFADWHIPSTEEFSTLVDTSIFYPGPTIQTAFFPEPPTVVKYWSGTTFRTRRATVWAWRFDYGSDYLQEKSEPISVRLIRGIPRTVGDEEAAAKKAAAK